MKISSFLSLIEQFSSDQKKELYQLSRLICDLYNVYGNTLTQATLISEVKSIHPEAALYLELIISTIWLDYCDELYRKLNVDDNSLLCSYHSTDKSLLNHLSKIQQWPIAAQWNDEIGVKIQSSWGKSYERTLEKDIEKLAR